MKLDSSRLIVIVGLVHSGTTILTHLLSQHSSIELGETGELGWTLEGPALYNEDTQSIKRMLSDCPDRLLLKLAWQEGFDISWMVRKIPDAKFLHIVKEFPVMCASWDKPTNLTTYELSHGTREYRKSFYDNGIKHLRVLKGANSYREVPYVNLLSGPSEELDLVVKWLDLPKFEFNTSLVSPDIDIKVVLGRDYDVQ